MTNILCFATLKVQTHPIKFQTIMAINSAQNQIAFSEKIGGARQVFEGKVYPLVGGATFNLAELPDYPNVLPAATPINFNEETRKISVHYAFEVAEAASTASVKVAKGIEGTRVKEGMLLMVAPATAETTGQSYLVTAVDASNPSYDMLTLGGTLTADKGTILVEANGGEASATAKMKVIPNCLTDRDVVKDPKAISVNGTGVFKSDAPVLTRRTAPICGAVKVALRDAGCSFYWSVRK